MVDLLPNHVNQTNSLIHGGAGILTMVPPSSDEFGDQQAQAFLSNAVLHRGRNGLRIRQLISPGQEFRNSFSVFFPVPAPNFLGSVGRLYLLSVSFDYEILGGNGSVTRVVAYDGTSVLESFTEFPHNAGPVELNLSKIRRIREALGVDLVLGVPLGIPVSLAVRYLQVGLVSSTAPVDPDPGPVVVDPS